MIVPECVNNHRAQVSRNYFWTIKTGFQFITPWGPFGQQCFLYPVYWIRQCHTYPTYDLCENVQSVFLKDSPHPQSDDLSRCHSNESVNRHQRNIYINLSIKRQLLLISSAPHSAGFLVKKQYTWRKLTIIKTNLSAWWKYCVFRRLGNHTASLYSLLTLVALNSQINYTELLCDWSEQTLIIEELDFGEKNQSQLEHIRNLQTILTMNQVGQKS